MNERELQDLELERTLIAMELPEIVVEAARDFRGVVSMLDFQFDVETFVVTYLITLCGMSGIDGPCAIRILHETGAITRMVEEITNQG